MNRECRDRDAPIQIKKVVSVLPNDYSLLENLPTLNGVSLLGDLSGKDVNLLSSADEDYDTVRLSEIESEDYVVCIGKKSAVKVPIADFIEESKSVKTVDVLDKDAHIGTIQFVIIK